MPLERHELEAIQADMCADDIEIPDAARAWSEEEAYAFFESGGTAWPNPQGLEATELLAYYEARKPATENHSASALLAALGKSLGMEDALAAEAAPTPPTPTPPPTPSFELLLALGCAHLAPGAAGLAELRALGEAALAPALAGLKLGPRQRLRGVLRAPPTAARRPRILCLHGNGTCGDILRRQTAALWAQLDADCTFLDGDLPTVASDPAISEFFPGLPQLRYATPSKLPAAGDAIEAGGTYVGLEAALERIAAAAAGAAEPYDGVVGFSQGANLAVALAAKLEAEKKPLRFVVAFCGSQFGWASQLPELFAAPLATPALLVRGEKDTLCPAPLCEALAALFRAGAVATVAHTAGHRPLPSAPQENVALCRRVARFAEAAVAVGS